MEKTVKISIIIPVYNVEQYLEQCLDSVLEQTLEAIEVVCVDDCSKDSSYNILQLYSNRDGRVRVFHFGEPKSALQARKTGVMAARGEYIMFLDADDYLESSACEKLYEKICNENVDILQFSSKIINCANLSEKRIKLNEKTLIPYERRLENEEVFDACFIEKKYSFTLWNKVFKTELCKLAFEKMEDKYLPKAQDLYSFFVIAYFAKSYMGWQSEPLHNYCFGRGVTASATMNLDKFERYCTQANIVETLRNFCGENNCIEKNKEVIEKFYKQWVIECVRLWKNELPKEYAAEGLEILYKYWGCKETIVYLSKEFWTKRFDIAGKLVDFPKSNIEKKNITTIGIYYYHYTIGGVQKVISLLAPIFIKLGYKVVIITDTEATENDFPVPEGVARATVLNKEKVNKESFGKRLDSWHRLIEEYQIDFVLYSAWTSSVILWDILYLKGRGIPLFIHTHSVFSFAVNKMKKMFYELPRIFTLADGLVTLSEADKSFWDAYNDNVHYIPNPISTELFYVNKGKWENKSLIWVGRVSDEKQPEAIFEIMEKVVSRISDVKLYLVGDFMGEKWITLTREKNLEDNIVFCGAIQNVNEYYEKASIHLSTSKYEGFPMTLIEAQSHELPTVMFKMPHLMMGTEECGVIGVDMLDYASAANEIVKLLINQSFWNEVSQKAKNSCDKLKEYDFEAAWRKVLNGEKATSSISKPIKNMIHTFVNHYNEGIKYQQGQESEEVLAIKNTISYRIGKLITYVPRKIRGLMWCCRDHGIKYTIKYVFKRG